jgi:hypothetical protein
MAGSFRSRVALCLTCVFRPGLACRSLAAPPSRPGGACLPFIASAVLPQLRQLGACLVQVAFGALGADPQIVTGLCQRRGPGVQHPPQLFALALGIGAGLAELPGGFLAGPVSVSAQLREFTRGVITSLLSGADEGGSIAVSALDRLPRLRR